MNPPGLNYFERISQSSKPHAVFAKDWSAYDELEFAGTFLPQAPVLEKDDYYFADAAELLNYSNFNDPLIYDLWPKDESVDICVFTYAENSTAAQNRSRYRLTHATLALFMEVTKADKVKIEISVGRNLRVFLSDLQRLNKAVYKKGAPVLAQTFTRTDLLKRMAGINSHKRLLEFAFEVM